MEQESERCWDQMVLQQEPGTVILDNRALVCVPRAYQRRIVLRAFSCLAGAEEWNMQDVEKVLQLSAKESAGSALTLHLKKGVLVNKSYDRMVFTTRTPDKKIEFSYKVSVPGRVEIAEVGQSYSLELVTAQEYQPGPDDIYLDYDWLPASLYLRSRRPGDYYRPPGMQGSKKLKKYFIDRKVPYAQRDRTVLLAGEDQEIYAVLGMGISRTAAVNSSTREILLIRSLSPGIPGEKYPNIE